MGWADRLSAWLLLGGAAFVLFTAWRLDIWSARGVPGPGFLPGLLGIALAAGALGIFWEARRAPARVEVRWFPDRASALRVCVLGACIAGFIAAIGPLGMLLSVGLFLLIFLTIYLSDHWVAVVLIAAGTPLGLYLVFERWLKLSLPHGFLGF